MGRCADGGSAGFAGSGQPGDGWFARLSARIGRIGADPRDDEDLRNKKALLVLLAVLILPVSVVWGSSYLAFGSLLGILPFIYFSISVASLVFFAKTKRFMPFLIVQLLDVMLMTALGMMLSGGFLPSGGVALWGFLAPLGALVFLEVRQAIGWFIAFVVTFLILGIVGELFFLDVDVPNWFTTTMLALNVIGTGAVAFTVLASFAHQRNEALAALRVEQARSEALITNVLPSSIAERLKDATGSIADHVECATILFADLVNFTPLAQRMSAAEVVGTLDRLFSHFDTLVERHGLEKIKTIGDAYMAAAGVPDPCDDHATRAAKLALDMREAIAASETAGYGGLELQDRHQLRVGHGRRDRHEALPLRPVGRRREHGEPHGVQRHARRDPDHALDLRADQGCVRLHAARHDPDQGQGRDGDLVPRRTGADQPRGHAWSRITSGSPLHDPVTTGRSCLSRYIASVVSGVEVKTSPPAP